MAKKTKTIIQHLKQIKPPRPDSHKGENGKLLIIGGSRLFHAASKWSLDIASKFVDMVFYTSTPENNQLIKEAKKEFWNGIIVPRIELETYLGEADCILIGPGMERQIEKSPNHLRPTANEWRNDTQKIINFLLHQYPQKNWVIDAGALQMIDPSLLNSNCIITPHEKELERLLIKLKIDTKKRNLRQISKSLNQALIVLKGKIDQIASPQEKIAIEGGNAGLTKGGTGDTLAGLIAALYSTQNRLTSAVVGSYINKQAGDHLYQTVGPYFNASDLVATIPKVLWRELTILNQLD